MMLTSAFTRERFFWLLMLHLNGNTKASNFLLHSLLFLSRIFPIDSLVTKLRIEESLFKYWKSLLYHPIYFPFIYLFIFFFWGSGLTNSNYTELNQLYEKYKDQGLFSKFYFLTVFCSAFSPLSLVSLKTGLEILAFPCNQFGAQEPGNNEEILEFACTRYKAEFPIFDKVEARLSSWYPVSYF